MARITVEDCLQKVNNRFALIHMAAKRVRQLRKGAEPTVLTKNRDAVIALREIAAGNVRQAKDLEQHNLIEDKMDNPLEEASEKSVEQALDEEKAEESDV